MTSASIAKFKLSNGLRFSGGKVSSDILYLGTNKPAAELCAGSITHADQAALYFAGLCDKYDIKTGLDAKTKKACRAHYEAVHANRGRGNWNNDAVYDTDLEKAGLYLLPGTQVQDGSIAVPWVIRPEWDEDMNPKIGKKSKTVIAILPPSGYGLIHLRDPNTGWVLQTRETRQEAEKLVAEEFSKFVGDSKASDLAKAEVSYSCRRAKGDGKSAVYRVFFSDDVGPFYEDAD